MNSTIILGEPLDAWTKKFPLLTSLINYNKVFWTNPQLHSFSNVQLQLNENHVKDAFERLKRFSSLIIKLFPETKETKGIVESPLKETLILKKELGNAFNSTIKGRLFLKCDNDLPIVGSVKARGSVYEVLKYAEDLAIRNGFLNVEDDYSKMASKKFKDFFGRYSISVGSTGNLGLSMAIISAELGFKVKVHMPSNANQWKKDLLKRKNVEVMEHKSDYSKAVTEGRKQSLMDPSGYFIDDENSTDLFLGYSTAAYRLKEQFENLGIIIDENHPLFVYIPCGVGAAAGGLTFGLKLLFKDNVHCFFAEPTHSPCMLLGLMTGKKHKISVQDFGIDNLTVADGLAVGTPSRFVSEFIENLVSGIYTVDDESLYAILSLLSDKENINVEPSAVAGIIGPTLLNKHENSIKYLKHMNLESKLENSYHLCWCTGGGLIPDKIRKDYYYKGKEIL